MSKYSRQNPIPEDTKLDIIKMYQDGLTCKAISEKINCSITSIWRLLNLAQIEMRLAGKITHGLCSEAAKKNIHKRTYVRYKVIEKLGGVCIKCGESDPKVLQINHLEDHENPISHKDLISILNKTYIGPKIDLRCANCNIRYEYKRNNRKDPPLNSLFNDCENFNQPALYHIAGSSLNTEELDLFLEILGADEWGSENPSEEELVEVAGRLCYQSWEPQTFNKNVTKIREFSKDYFNNLLKSGHGSVLEHLSDTYIIYCSRICANEIVRHRHASYSQESLRYVRLDKLDLYFPDAFLNHPLSEQLQDIFKQKIKSDEELIQKLNTLLDLDNLTSFDQKKKLTSAIRRLAPMGLMTYITMTSNVRNWRHMIQMRTSSHAEEEIRKVFNLIYLDQKERYPNLYQDSQEEMVDGFPEITFKNEKI